MTNSEKEMNIPVSFDRESGFDLLSLASALGNDKKIIALITVVAALVAFIVCLIWPKSYSAKTILLPPQSGQSGSASVLATLGVLSTAAGLAGSSALKSPEELYVSLLKSRTIADALIAQFALKDRYDENTLTETRRELAKRVTIEGEKRSGLVTIEAEDHDPQFAANLANAYADQLRQLMTRVAVTDAQQRRLYLEQQVQRSKDELAKAEMVFEKAQGRLGLTSIDVSAQGAIREAAELRVRIAALEIEQHMMAAYATPHHPDAERLAVELSSLREQLGKVETGDGKMPHISDAALANIRAYRDLKYQEAVLGSLIAQFESARAEEAKEAPLVQQVDLAVVPDKKSRPRTWLVVSLTATLTLLASSFASLLRHSWKIAMSRDDIRPRLDQLIQNWSPTTGP